jgi:predicted RNase H-like nuclease
MSISATLYINLAPRANQNISSVQVIKLLIDSGWRMNNEGGICYLPLGDKDAFDWKADLLSENDFFDLVLKKEDANEVVGVDLFWADTEVGVILLMHGNNKFSFGADIYRKTLAGNITDVNWYLERIIPHLNNDSFVIENFQFVQM